MVFQIFLRKIFKVLQNVSTFRTKYYQMKNKFKDLIVIKIKRKCVEMTLFGMKARIWTDTRDILWHSILFLLVNVLTTWWSCESHHLIHVVIYFKSIHEAWKSKSHCHTPWLSRFPKEMHNLILCLSWISGYPGTSLVVNVIGSPEINRVEHGILQRKMLIKSQQGTYKYSKFTNSSIM